MIQRHFRYRNRRLLAACGVLLLCLFNLEAQERPSMAPVVTVPDLLESAVATPTLPDVQGLGNRILPLNPLDYLQRARRNYEHRIRDYACRFTKRERLNDRLSREQVCEVKFREAPFSVYMHVVQNPGPYRRVLYIRNQFASDGRERAVIEPEGPIARLLVRSVLRPIEGAEARRYSRRSIAHFGFGGTLDLILRYAELSAELGRLQLRFLGEGEVDGRPTYMFERRLPLDDTTVDWPDALLVFHMDQEWQVPVSCTAYADHEGRNLLGEYRYTDVQMNVGLESDDFDPETYGL